MGNYMHRITRSRRDQEPVELRERPSLSRPGSEVSIVAQTVAEVNGTNIHFIQAAGRGPNPVPLLLMQGWPSSFVQMLDIIPLLTEARDDGTPCFDVVAASLPDYPSPREWAERSFNVKRWTILERGGHFLEWEVPHEVANDIRLFFSEVA